MKIGTSIDLRDSISLIPQPAIPPTMSPGQRLRPRYLTNIHPNCLDVAGVWNKRPALPEFQIE
ncbi:MAG: hypothetical protein AB1424_17155 [Thermodesulfobacteriota bacterium]